MWLTNSYRIFKERSCFRIFGITSIILLILINPFTACKQTSSPFYDNVLNDFDTTSYFIALNLKSPFYKGRVIIENKNLYYFLNKTKGLNKEKYQSTMKKILVHNRTLRIDERDILKWNFIKVSTLESVIIAANRGRDSFIINYFTGVSLNYGITDEERNAVIDQLFYWKIPAKIDKLTGNLMIG